MFPCPCQTIPWRCWRSLARKPARRQHNKSPAEVLNLRTGATERKKADRGRTDGRTDGENEIIRRQRNLLDNFVAQVVKNDGHRWNATNPEIGHGGGGSSSSGLASRGSEEGRADEAKNSRASSSFRYFSFSTQNMPMADQVVLDSQHKRKSNDVMCVGRTTSGRAAAVSTGLEGGKKKKKAKAGRTDGLTGSSSCSSC